MFLKKYIFHYKIVDLFFVRVVCPNLLNPLASGLINSSSHNSCICILTNSILMLMKINQGCFLLWARLVIHPWVWQALVFKACHMVFKSPMDSIHVAVNHHIRNAYDNFLPKVTITIKTVILNILSEFWKNWMLTHNNLRITILSYICVLKGLSWSAAIQMYGKMAI